MSRKQASKPVDISVIKEMFDREYERMIYELFVTKFNHHGWTHEEFLDEAINYLKRERMEKSHKLH